MRIAVDAMGGDSAPSEIVKGAVNAARKFSDHEIILVGDQKQIHNELNVFGATPNNISVIHSSKCDQKYRISRF